MTAAAERLHVAQPAVSQTVKELETYYGVRLFERLSKRLYPTAAATGILPYARHLLNLHRDMENELFRTGTASIVRVGASVTIGTCLLGGILDDFRKAFPDALVEARVDNTRIIESMLLEDKVDLGFVEGVVRSPELTATPFMDDELILVGPPGHRLAGRKEATPADLEGERFVIREEGSGTRELFESVMAAAGLSWKAAWVCNNAETIKNAIALGMGLTVISRLAVQAEIREKTLVTTPLRGLNFRRKFSVVRHKNKFFTPAMRKLAESVFTPSHRDNSDPVSSVRKPRGRLSGKA